MKKLYISQPMKGKTREEIIEAREKAIECVKSKVEDEIQVIDSYFGAVPPKKPLYLLGKCLEVMADADIIYFVEGWQDYRGCKIEHQCAEEYGIEIIN